MEKIYVWGTGRYSERLIHIILKWNSYCDSKQVYIENFIDNNESKHEKDFHNKKVFGCDDFFLLYRKDFKIVVAVKKYEDIFSQLENRGLVYQKDFFLMSDFLRDLICKDDLKMIVDHSVSLYQKNMYLDERARLLFYVSKYLCDERRQNKDFNEVREKILSLQLEVYNDTLLDMARQNYLYNKSNKIEYDDMRDIMKFAKMPVMFQGLESVRIPMKCLFDTVCEIRFAERVSEVWDLFLVHGYNIDFDIAKLLLEFDKCGKPTIFFEDGFIRSITPGKGFMTDIKYSFGHSFIFDGMGIYFNANAPSVMENVLNSSFELSYEQLKRASDIKRKIVKNKISKYNHQPIMEINVGRKSAKKVLVIDQVPNDKSIVFGMASKNTFGEMLECAIFENPESDILIKTHPATNKTHYRNIISQGNVYVIDYDINPISLLEFVDKVYVCTSQMGFEAVMCGKEVHVFGMPFYANWGFTIDRQRCERRLKTRTVDEFVYIVYIMLTTYVSYRNKKKCEIEQVIDEIIELREEYFQQKKET